MDNWYVLQIYIYHADVETLVACLFILNILLMSLFFLIDIRPNLHFVRVDKIIYVALVYIIIEWAKVHMCEIYVLMFLLWIHKFRNYIMKYSSNFKGLIYREGEKTVNSCSSNLCKLEWSRLAKCVKRLKNCKQGSWMIKSTFLMSFRKKWEFYN